VTTEGGSAAARSGLAAATLSVFARDCHCRDGRSPSAPAEGRDTRAYAAQSGRDEVVSADTPVSS
jgi:hypothetical protein